MATTILLVRHAAHDRVHDVLCGRMPGVHLGEPGLRQARRLGRRLAPVRPAAIHASPQPRCQETAELIAERAGLAVAICAALDEIDFGEWTGRDFASLADDRDWRHWNAARGTARPPGGESMAEVQRRVSAWLAGLPAAYPDAVVVAVSHGDVIKAALADCLGLPLDAHGRFEIGPASVSAVALWRGGAKVLCVNGSGIGVA